MQSSHSERIADCLIGTAVGDALGLPREGLSRERAARMFGQGRLSHRLFLGRGMLSDDTAHAEMTLAAYARCDGDVDRFGKLLSSEMRQWFLTIPPGLGLATLKSCLKICVGVSPNKSGVWSAGNGPAMRAPMLGVLIEDLDELDRFVAVSTRLTHTDPLALEGARLVARLAHLAARRKRLEIEETFDMVRSLGLSETWSQGVVAAERGLREELATSHFLEGIGLGKGVSGFIVHTSLAVLYCSVRHGGDIGPALEDAIRGGGDSDTVGAIVGGVCGPASGLGRIDPEWIAGIRDWPGPERLERLAVRVCAGERVGSYWRRNPWPLMVGRNALLLAVVLGHGFRRLLPPY